MPNPPSARPALSDIALRETLDLMGAVIASMSERLDQHGKTLADVKKASAESRDAAQAAKTYADPQRYGRHIGQELDKAMGTSLNRLEALHTGFAADRQETRRKLEDLIRQEEAVLQRLRDDLASAGRWKKRIPFIAIFGLVLVLGLTVVLPRFLTSYGPACQAIGGAWTRSTTGAQVCVFYAG